jgi:hypothetical protein
MALSCPSQIGTAVKIRIGSIAVQCGIENIKSGMLETELRRMSAQLC